MANQVPVENRSNNNNNMNKGNNKGPKPRQNVANSNVVAIGNIVTLPNDSVYYHVTEILDLGEKNHNRHLVRRSRDSSPERTHNPLPQHPTT